MGIEVNGVERHPRVKKRTENRDGERNKGCVVCTCVVQRSIRALLGARDRKDRVLSGVCGNSGDLPSRLQANTLERHTHARNSTAKSVLQIKAEDAP